MARANVFGKANIVIGDSTTHGGVVIKGCDTATWNGMQVARVGDLVFCPKCKFVFPIIQGESRVNIMGKAVALEGHKTLCGAELIAQEAAANIQSDAVKFIQNQEQNN